MSNPFLPYSVAVVTPFEADGTLAEAPVRAHLERLAGLGVPAFLVSGSTGEQHSMSVDEKVRLYGWAMKAAAGRPVYAGVAALNTAHAVALARGAEAAGAQGLLLGFPPYLRLTALDARHYAGRVAASTGLPIMVYNNPLRTAFDLTPATLDAIAAEHPTVKAIKETGDPTRAKTIRAALGADFGVFSGSDRAFVDHWDQGYTGLTSVAGNLWPAEMAQVVADLVAGRPDRARATVSALAPALQVVVETHLPASLKLGLRTLGLPGGWCRDPLGHLAPEVEAAIEAALVGTFDDWGHRRSV